tara:strand:- start:61 stop:636 length:576 start_codon:yes stop_codon:yes gene_type:complete
MKNKTHLNMRGFKLPHQNNTPLYNNGMTAGGWNSSSGGSNEQRTFKLTPSQIAEAERLQDSIEDSYMTQKFRLGRFIKGEDGAFIVGPDGKKVREKIMLTDEDRLRNYEMEKGAKFIDFTQDGEAVVKNTPSGDDDIYSQSFIKSLDKSQYRGDIPKDSDLPEDYQDPGLIKGHPLNPFEGYERVENYRKN